LDDLELTAIDTNTATQDQETQNNGGHEEPDTPLSSASQSHYQPSNGNGLFTVNKHPTAGKIYGQGKTFMDTYHNNQYNSICQDNPYYPFASAQDWEVADFLLCSPLSMAQIDKFIKLKLVCVPACLHGYLSSLEIKLMFA
jgi:hypothetical protein